MTTQEFLLICDLLPEPTLLVSAGGIVSAANQAAHRLFVFPTEGETDLTAIVVESAEDVIRYLKRCSASRQLVLGALTFIRGSGEPIACRAEGAVLRPRRQDVEALILLRVVPKNTTTKRFLELNEQVERLNREIGRRRHTEGELRAQKEWLQVTLESIGDAVIATDAAGNIVFLNPVAEAYLGWTEEESVGRPLTELFRIINEYSRVPVDNPVSEVIRKGVVVGLANHTILIDRHGGERPIEDSAAPIKDSDGRLLGVILVFHDVTVQRNAERELRKADRRKDEFLATLAHELRNPLAPIRNSLEILKHVAPADTEAIRNAHATMDRQLSQMVRLIDDLLDVSRISRGKLEIRRQRTEIQSILHQAVEACRPAIDRAGHRLELTLPSDPLYLEGDAVRLAQVFSNLLTNACKFTPPGGRIQLTCRSVGEEVEVIVQDSGVGIPSDQLDSIFEMFSQVDSSLERSQGGLGIGLNLVRQVVALHGGTVEARSEGRNLGSRFLVQLPLIKTNIPRPAVASSDSQTPTPIGLRILVVDDNRDSALSLAMLLKMLGNTVKTAFDGAEAVSVAAEFEPEVILLDIGLPKLNGYEACRAIRKHDRDSRICIIALTGWGQEEDRRKSAEAGFDGHLTKPVEQAVLSKLLAELLSEKT